MKDVSLFEQEQICSMHKKGKSIMEIARHLSIKKAIIERVIKNNVGKKDTGGVSLSKKRISLKINSAEDVKALIVRNIEKLEAQPTEAKTTNAIFYGCNLLLGFYKDLKDQEIEERIKKLEGVLCQRKEGLKK